MKILVLDNYDSFTYNLVQMIERISGKTPDVFKNDEITLDQVADYDKIILSPGPGIPSGAGILKKLIEIYAEQKSILGVCLGHQAIAEVFGAEIINLSEIFHGVSTNIDILYEHSIFNGLTQKIPVGRYHSWAVSKENFPAELTITSEDEHGIMMSLKHKIYDVHGVQFHPESILTPHGRRILENFLSRLC